MDTAANWSLLSNFSLHHEFPYCAVPSMLISAFGFSKHILIVPFAILVFYDGHQRWRQQHSFHTVSQTDHITYHFAFLQLFGVPGIIFYVCGLYVPPLSIVKDCILALIIVGELSFHVVTCVERYLAVVHPITYLELKNTKGAKISRLSIGGVWLFSFGWSIAVGFYSPYVPLIPSLCLAIFCFTVVSFCSLSVLCALIRPGPGEVSGKKKHVDQSKQKAFHTIMAITGALWLLLIGHVVSVALTLSEQLNNDGCWVIASIVWLGLPSSLVVPLLYLHRAGKLRCCCARAE